MNRAARRNLERTIRQKAANPRDWGEWSPASLPDTVPEAVILAGMRVSQLPREHIESVIMDEIGRTEAVWMNNIYQVNVTRRDGVEGWPAMIHLSIKRRDKQPVGVEHFRDFQRIKDELVGTDHEAVELYPAKERLVDTANQYHLWVLTKAGIRFPFGYADGLVDGISDGGAVQRPFE